MFGRSVYMVFKRIARWCCLFGDIPYFRSEIADFGCNDKGQHFQDRIERAGKHGKVDQPEVEMQRLVTSSLDYPGSVGWQHF